MVEFRSPIGELRHRRSSKVFALYWLNESTSQGTRLSIAKLGQHVMRARPSRERRLLTFRAHSRRRLNERRASIGSKRLVLIEITHQQLGVDAAIEVKDPRPKAQF